MGSRIPRHDNGVRHDFRLPQEGPEFPGRGTWAVAAANFARPNRKRPSGRFLFTCRSAPYVMLNAFSLLCRGATMTENVEHLILEHLKALRGEFSAFKADMSEVKLRLTSLEERTSLLERSVANLHGDIALLHSRLDRMDGRLERIERRLELVPSA